MTDKGEGSILAVDVGGTKTLVAFFDDSGQIIHKERFATPATYQELLNQLKTVVDKFSAPISRAAIAIPGRLDRKTGTGISYGNLGCKSRLRSYAWLPSSCRE
jgi:predicted NBD/HSP70 family sugar kinase